MIIGNVVGRLWNDRQIPSLADRRLVVVRQSDGAITVAADLIDVAAGNTVLLTCDDAAQEIAGTGIDAAVVALVSGADHFGREP
ncbi:EutN/CcmL family microcompartment protein [Amycolatopsis jejuensis]|uniref:EutN/CcmL family microcompartment protein n=1 Tax=Amycolatopsis jejuensis TaxID=330084 RepID=UPI000526287C|nr:EutN/CcmL family microcompartment protein [Amycolatopsis jejuensis]